MSNMPSFSHYDPFSVQTCSPTLFDNQNSYLQPVAFSPLSYATPHPFPVDPRWYNTTFSGHAAPHQFSPMTHSVITPPPDLLSLSPSSTIAPIPPLSGSRNRSRSMSNRIRSFNPTARIPRQTSSGSSARGGTNQRISRRSTISSSPSVGHNNQPLQSPTMGMLSSPSTSYLHSPTMLDQQHEAAPDSHETRASKRRRTDDVDSASLQSYSTVPEPPHLLTPTQPPHLALMHGVHGYPSSQTWAGPPSAGHLPHGHGHVSPDHHGYNTTQWPPAPLPYFTPQHATSDHQGLGDHLHHHHHQQQHHPFAGTTIDASSHTPILPYPSPTVAGPGFFNNSPEPEAPVSAVSTHFQFHKMEPDSPSPRLLEDVAQHQRQPSFDSFEHGPTEFPPRAYPGGVDAKSPWVPTKQVGKIFGSRLEQMPAIENRLAKLEDQLDRYLDGRAAQSLRNSLLPGLESQSQPMEYTPFGPCRMFGGRIWPTALARRVRRTPRD